MKILKSLQLFYTTVNAEKSYHVPEIFFKGLINKDLV
jgi:hypothetical protein